MISFITGKPGDGKTLFATRYMLGEMVTKSLGKGFFVVTNIPIRWGNFREYLVAETKGRDIDLDACLKVIPDQEVYEFYRHRSGGLVLDWSPDKTAGDDGAKRLPRPEFTARMKESFKAMLGDPSYQLPVHYYIDEAHNFFSSREWATNGRGLLYYASQHRHLHDEIFLITQVMENVEKQLRSLVSETHQVRNQLRRRIGPFQMRPIFRVKSFYGVPSGPVKPFAETTFPLDPAKVAGCYKTVGALGIQSAPEQLPQKAPLPWWALPAGGMALVLLVLVGFLSLPYLGAKMGSGVVKGSLAGMGSKVPERSPGETKKPGILDAMHWRERLPAEEKTQKTPDDEPKFVLRGYWVDQTGGLVRVHAILADGREIPANEIEDFDFRQKGFEWVKWRGARVFAESPEERAERDRRRREEVSATGVAEKAS